VTGTPGTARPMLAGACQDSKNRWKRRHAALVREAMARLRAEGRAPQSRERAGLSPAREQHCRAHANELLMLSHGAGNCPKPGAPPSLLISAVGSSRRGIVVWCGEGEILRFRWTRWSSGWSHDQTFEPRETWPCPWYLLDTRKRWEDLLMEVTPLEESTRRWSHRAFGYHHGSREHINEVPLN
jgi:hypothetical protein